MVITIALPHSGIITANGRVMAFCIMTGSATSLPVCQINSRCNSPINHDTASPKLHRGLPVFYAFPAEIMYLGITDEAFSLTQKALSHFLLKALWTTDSSKSRSSILLMDTRRNTGNSMTRASRHNASSNNGGSPSTSPRFPSPKRKRELTPSSIWCLTKAKAFQPRTSGMTPRRSSMNSAAI